MKNQLWFILILLAGSVCFANTSPVVSNVSVSQRTDSSGMVDIYYTLSDTDNDKCTITVLASSDGGNMWSITPSSLALSGDLTNVSPGNRHISWNSKLDLPGVFGTNYRIKITADDGYKSTLMDDVQTIALYHMEIWSWYGTIFTLDDNSLPQSRSNVLEFGAGDVSPQWPVNTDPCLVTPGYDGTGHALAFDGIDDEAKVTTATAWPGYSQFSVDMEFKALRATNTQTLIEATKTWSISLVNADVVLTIWTTNLGIRTYTFPNAVAVNQWQHVVVSCNSVGHVKFQLGSQVIQGDGDTLILQSTEIAVGNTYGNYQRYFRGYIDELKISSADRLGWFNDNYETVALWHMDSKVAQGTSIPQRNFILDDDSVMTGRNHDLKLGQKADPAGTTEPIFVAGQSGYGNALLFDGIDDIAVCASGWAGQKNVIVDLWVVPTDATRVQTVIWVGECEIRWDPTNNKFIGYAYDTQNIARAVSVYVNVNGTLNVWQHLRLTALNSVLTLTVNGTSGSYSPFTGLYDASGDIGVGNKPLQTRYFKGLIDEISIVTPP